jgi:hypothetical protein
LFSLLSPPTRFLLDKYKEWWDEIDVGEFFFFGVGWVGIRHEVLTFGTWVKDAISFEN